LISGVVENEPITESKLAPKGAGAGLPPTITPGMRAISVQVNDVINVAGFVTPGTRVDVLTIIQHRDGEPTSRVVVSNVQVLTGNTRYDQEESKEGEAVRSTVVTLMVTPQDAERIALAQSRGQLMLTLRNPLDVDPTVTTGVTTAALFASAPAPAKPVTRRTSAPAPSAPAAPPPVIAPPSYLVETFKGGKKSEDTLNTR
jgi:pilus assembly protein CpaB